MDAHIMRLVTAASISCALIFSAHAPASAEVTPTPLPTLAPVPTPLPLSTPVAVPTPRMPPTPLPASVATPVPATPLPYPCNSVNAYVTRPSISTSVCAVQPGQVVIETGYTNTTTTGAGPSSTTSVPQAFIRTGIAQRIEFNISSPTIENTKNGLAKVSGSSDLGFGVKAVLGYTPRAQYGAGIALTVPTGSPAYTNGANTYALLLNGNYALSSNLSLFGTAAFNSLVGIDANGNLARFGAFVPSLGVTYSLPSNWYLFGEAANFSRVAPGSTSRNVLDYGIVKPIGHFQFDAEIGNALNAVNGSRFHYVGAGVSVLFGAQ